MASLFAASLGLAGVALGSRAALRAFHQVSNATPIQNLKGATSPQSPQDVSWFRAFQYHLFNPRAPPPGGSKSFIPGGFERQMTRKEAALILGVSETETPEKINRAYKKILLKNHPDRGGSTHLATKINEAKDHLISGRS